MTQIYLLYGIAQTKNLRVVTSSCPNQMGFQQEQPDVAKCTLFHYAMTIMSWNDA